MMKTNNGSKQVKPVEINFGLDLVKLNRKDKIVSFIAFGFCGMCILHLLKYWRYT